MTITIGQDFGNVPFALLLYGQAGIGKTTFACRAPKPLICNIEGGLKGIDLKALGAFATNQLSTYADVEEVFTRMAKTDKFDTLIIDSVSRMQDLLIRHICEGEKPPKTSLADFGYGAGYARLAAEAQLFCERIDALKRAGKNIVLIAHEAVETFADPEADAYDRFNCSLDKRISGKVQAAVDHVWYMHQEKTIKEASSGRQTAKLRGRVLVQTKASGGVIAKTRGEREQYIQVRNDDSDREIWEGL